MQERKKHLVLLKPSGGKRMWKDPFTPSSLRMSLQKTRERKSACVVVYIKASCKLHSLHDSLQTGVFSFQL